MRDFSNLTVTRFNRRKARLIRNIRKAQFLLNTSEVGSEMEVKATRMYRRAKQNIRQFRKYYGAHFAQ
jgi:hypothetical protein